MSTDVTPFPFATVDELRARWPDMPPGADNHASTLLEDASQFILDMIPTAGEAAEGTRRRIVCAVVKRAMSAGDLAGLTSYTQMTGSFQQQASPVNPNGDFYLTKVERRALGHGRQKAFSVRIAPARPVAHEPWCVLEFGATYCSCGATSGTAA